MGTVADSLTNCDAPLTSEGGAIPGGFFRWPLKCEWAWRWDPLSSRNARGEAVAAWVPWPMPEAPVATLGQKIAQAVGLLDDEGESESAKPSAETSKGEDSSDDKDSETAAKAAADMYGKAIERYRDSLKWLVISAGAVATAVVGTAPLSGLAQAIPRRGGGYAGTGFVLLIASLALILLAVALVLRPAGTNTAELGSSPQRRAFGRRRRG